MFSVRTFLFALVLVCAACGGCTEDEPQNGGNVGTNSETNNTSTPDMGGGTDACMANAVCPEEFECGTASVDDGCGGETDVDCGACADGETCVDNVCECEPETGPELCAAAMADCGDLTVEDRCGETQTVNCGTCTDPEACGAGGTDNVCGCPCDIDGTCVPEGMANPDNGCEVCDPTRATDAWSPLAEGSACDDGISCTNSSICDATGACVAGVPDQGFCLIDGACVTSGETNPANPCEQCVSDRDPIDWSPYDDVPCDDGDGLSCTGVCQGGSCQSAARDGRCLIDGTCYTDGDDNPSAICEQCVPETDQLSWSQARVGAACDDGLSCTPNSACGEAGACEPGPPAMDMCAIDGACWMDGAANPNNPCEECDAANPLGWSPVAADTTCDDDLTCTTNDVCDGAGSCVGDIDASSCAVDGACFADATVNPNNPCEVCSVADATDAWTPVAIDTVCSTGLSCATGGTCDGAGTCVPDAIDAGSCVIGATCYADGDPNPDNPCDYCESAASQVEWSDNDGATCEDGDGLDCTGLCFAGTCQPDVRADACALDGACYTDGEINPANPCETCDVDQPDEWAGVAQGTTCDDGLDCTSDDACDGDGDCVGDVDMMCAIDDTCFPDGAVNPTNPCQVCDSASNAYNWTSVPMGTACDDGRACTSNTTCDGMNNCTGDLVADYCLIRDTCYGEGATQPGNECQYCDSTADPTDWTLEPNGTVCDDGLACTGDGTCNPGGQCREGQPNDDVTCAVDDACWMDGAVNPDNPCEICDASEDANAWTPNAPGTVCADGLDCTVLDVCDADGGCSGTLQQGSCAIDGACWVDGAANPDNPCQFCDADADPTDWSPLPEDTLCDDGLDCTSADACDDAGTCGGTVDAGACAVDGTCFANGDSNPMNECEVCDSTSPVEWSPVADDTACGPNGANVCCTGACQLTCP